MQTLLSIADDARALLDLLDSCPDGELDDATSAALDKWMGEIQRTAEAKVEGYAVIIRTLELRAAARKEERERLARLVQADENNVKRLKDRLLIYFTATGTKRIDTPRFRVSVCANGGVVPLVMPLEPRDLPPEFQRREVVADVDVIRKVLELGQEIPGCRLLARGSHVRIA